MPNTAFKMISDDRANPGVQNWRPGPGSSYHRLKSGPATGFGPGSKNQNIGISFFHNGIPFCLKRIPASSVLVLQSSDSIRNYAAGLAAAVQKGFGEPSLRA
jgi:hypothetical protein